MAKKAERILDIAGLIIVGSFLLLNTLFLIFASLYFFF